MRPYNGRRDRDGRDEGAGRLSRILERLRLGPLVSDGAMGTSLQALGLTAGSAPEEWNLSHPEQVRAVSACYVAAGAEMVTTNTFGGNFLTLSAHGLGERLREINVEGVRLARAGAGPHCFVAASIGPTGRFLEPLGDLSPQEAADRLGEQARVLEEAGADVILVETMMAIEEAKAAVAGAKAATSVPVFCTMAFGPNGRTLFGVSPEEMVDRLPAAGADAIGLNCGAGPRELEEVAEKIIDLCPVPVIVQPNAGLPQVVGGKTVYPETPEGMAEYARRFAERGAKILGACCGSTPEHIRAIAQAVGHL